LERKSMPMVAWYVLSKESYMKRVIREVLPTVWKENVRRWVRFGKHWVVG
jgi:hypothetical protein